MTINWNDPVVSVRSVDLDNSAYHARPEISRSYAHQIYRYGGRGQYLLERGVRLVGQNQSLTRGTQFDQLWEARASGKSIGDLFVTPPSSVLASDGSRRGKPYTEWAAQQTAQIATEADLEILELMWASVELNDRAMELLGDTSDTQRSVFWTDSAGHRRKARFDGQTSSLVYDVKTTSSPWSLLHKSFLDYGYVWQASWYRDAAYAIEYEPFRMPFIVVQTVAPYECSVVTIPEELVEAAASQISTTLDLVRFRKTTGEYLPDDYGAERELEFPAWAWKQEVYSDADTEC